MGIYVTFVSFVLTCACIEKHDTNIKIGKISVKQKTIFASIELLLLFIICGMHSNNVGYDMNVYKSWFQDFTQMDYDRFSNSAFSSPGFFVLNRLTILLNGDFRDFIWIYSLVIVFFLGMSLHKMSHNFSLALFFFLTSGGMQLILCLLRQSLACVFILYAYSLLVNDKKIKALIAFLVAISFHSSAAVAIIILIPVLFKNKKQYHIYLIMNIIAICVLIVTKASFLIRLYSEDRGYTYDATSQGGTTFFLMILVINTLCLIGQKRLKSRFDYEERLHMYIVVLGSLFQALALFVSIFARLMLYFVAFYAFLIPRTTLKLKKDNKVVYTFALSFIFMAYFIFLLMTNAYGIVPYEMYTQ